MKILILMVFCLLTATTCKEKSTKSNQNVNTTRYNHWLNIDSKGKHYNGLAEIPEHLRTPEQKLYVKSASDVLLNGVVVENNHLVLKFSKEECLARGMTERDYNELQANFKDNNHVYDSLGNQNVAELLADLQKDIRANQSGK